MTLNLNKTSDEHRALVKELAEKSFENHFLKKTSTGAWLCQRKDKSSPYHFFVRFEPGAVLVWGDLGEFVLRHTDHESCAWFLTAGSRDYLLSKVRASEGQKRRFCYGDAIKYLDGLVTEAENDRDEDGNLTDHARLTIDHVSVVRNEMSDVEHDASEEQHRVWVESWNDLDDWDPPQCAAWEPHMCWLWEMRELFVRLFWERVSADPKNMTTADAHAVIARAEATP